MIGADDGEPVPEVTVLVRHGPGSAPDIAAVTDRYGRFALDELPEGEWVLEARGPEGESGSASVRVYADGVTDATIRLM